MKELQDFLTQNKVQFDKEPPKEQVRAAKRKQRRLERAEAAGKGEEVKEEEDIDEDEDDG